jgi:hypothetical protein
MHFLDELRAASGAKIVWSGATRHFETVTCEQQRDVDSLLAQCKIRWDAPGLCIGMMSHRQVIAPEQRRVATSIIGRNTFRVEVAFSLESEGPTPGFGLRVTVTLPEKGRNLSTLLVKSAELWNADWASVGFERPRPQGAEDAEKPQIGILTFLSSRTFERPTILGFDIVETGAGWLLTVTPGKAEEVAARLAELRTAIQLRRAEQEKAEEKKPSWWEAPAPSPFVTEDLPMDAFFPKGRDPLPFARRESPRPQFIAEIEARRASAPPAATSSVTTEDLPRDFFTGLPPNPFSKASAQPTGPTDDAEAAAKTQLMPIYQGSTGSQPPPPATRVLPPPELSLEQYADLCASLKVSPEDRAAHFAKYGLATLDDARRVHEHFAIRFKVDPALEPRFRELMNRLATAYLEKNTGGRL